MNRKPCRFAHWASCGVLFGWSLCSLSGLPAQTLPRNGAASGTPQAAYPVVSTTGVAPAMGHGADEIRLQLAWLGDPATFALHLKIHSSSAGYKVVGAVPNTAVKQRVMNIAAQQTSLPVECGLTVVPGMSGRGAGILSPVELERRALAAIEHALPECAADLRVKADSSGRVTLSGKTKTMQQQLAACVSLRAIPEVACVVCQLSLTSSPPAPAVAVMPPKMQHSKPVPLPPAVSPLVAPSPPVVLSLPPAPASPPVAPSPPPAPIKQTAPVSKTVWTAASSPPAPPAPMPLPPAPSAKTAPGLAATAVKPAASHSSSMMYTRPPQLVAQPVESKAAEPKDLPAAIQKDTPGLGEPYKAVAVVTWAPEVIKKTAWVASSQTSPQPTPAPVVQPVKQPVPLPPPLPLLPPAPKVKTDITPEPAKTSPTLFPLLQATKPPGTIPQEPTKPSAAPTKPSAAPTKPSAAPTKPSAAPTKPSAAPTKPSAAPKPAQMLTNPMKFLVKPAPETQAIAPVATPIATAMPVTQVRMLVEKRCGNNARVADVRYLPDGNLEVRMAVPTDAAAPQIFDQIMSIPELAPYRMKVRFDADQ